MVERYVRDVEAACSNHVTPITEKSVNTRVCRVCKPLYYVQPNFCLAVLPNEIHLFQDANVTGDTS